jgi:stage II sporulation protein D
VPPPANLPPATRPAKIDHEPLLDVGLAWDLDSLTLAPVQEVRITSSPGLSLPEERVASAISIRRTEAGIEASWKGAGGAARSFALARAETLWIGGPDPASMTAQRVRWLGRTWRGRIKIFSNPRSTITLATRLPLETYLIGVVPGEIGVLAEEQTQAGRAQAVAARSYTLFYQGRRGSEGFDLYGSVEDQVYSPVETERPLATAAVDNTRGQVALYDGAPIRANYYSTCGGITADVWEAWPAEQIPYLVSHADRGTTGDYCAGSPSYRWREEWPVQEFMGNLKNFGRLEGAPIPAAGPGELIDIRTLSRSKSGRVWRLAVETTTGEIQLTADMIRRVLRRSGNPNVILRSNLFKIDVRRDRASRRALAVVASGAGSGHGVGLCQTGAIAMAKAHQSAERILLHYYPGIEIKRLYP